MSECHDESSISLILFNTSETSVAWCINTILVIVYLMPPFLNAFELAYLTIVAWVLTCHASSSPMPMSLKLLFASCDDTTHCADTRLCQICKVVYFAHDRQLDSWCFWMFAVNHPRCRTGKLCQAGIVVFGKAVRVKVGTLL